MTEPNSHDHTADIGNPEQALLLAEWLLQRASRPDPDGHEAPLSGIWRTMATIPLAAILYTVSPACPAGGGGLLKALDIAKNPEPTPEAGDDNWISAADRCAHTYLADRLRVSATFTERQRNSVRDIILDALDVLLDHRQQQLPCLRSGK